MCKGKNGAVWPAMFGMGMRLERRQMLDHGRLFVIR